MTNVLESTCSMNKSITMIHITFLHVDDAIYQWGPVTQDIAFGSQYDSRNDHYCGQSPYKCNKKSPWKFMAEVHSHEIVPWQNPQRGEFPRPMNFFQILWKLNLFKSCENNKYLHNTREIEYSWCNKTHENGKCLSNACKTEFSWGSDLVNNWILPDEKAGPWKIKISLQYRWNWIFMG